MCGRSSKRFWALLSGIGFWSLLGGQSWGSIYDTATAWWHFDYADSGTITDPSEVRDARDWYTPAGWKATSIYGTPEWTIQSVSGPGGGQNYGGRSILFTPAVDPGGNVTPDYIEISNLALAGSSTLVTRFRFDGYASDWTATWLYRNAFGYGDPNQPGYGGWLFGLEGTNRNLRLLFGNVSFRASLTVNIGTWYDAAVVVTDNGTNDSIEFYLWDENGALQYQKITTDRITKNIGSAYTRIGAEDAAGNAKKAFQGAINHLAVWNRALSTAEVLEAFGYPGPLWQIGLDNNANVDFNVENSSGNNYTIGEPWGKLSRAVTSYGNSQVHINFNADALQAALPYVFHLDMATQSGNIGFSVLVNGQKLGTFTANSNTDYLVYVPAGLLQTGTNTLTLQYESGTGYTTWDWMEFGGSWQVGYDDNSQAEFIAEGSAPDDFYVWDPNWQHLERAVTVSDPEVNLHFTLSEELADFAYLYTTKIILQGGGNHPIDILINGQLLASLPAQPNGTYVNLFILPDQLRPGDNYLTLRYQDTVTGWVQFDFHRLSVFVPEPASVGLLGLGGMLLAGWIARLASAKRKPRN